MADKLKSLETRTRFATGDVASINGMLQSGSLSIIWSLLEIQDYLNVTGDIAEIGVHQGKLFLLLCHWLNRGETGYAIDIFGRPVGSDTENIDALIANLEQFKIPEDHYRLEICDSIELSGGSLRDIIGGAGVRLFSVDGDHSKKAVLHDLAIAESVLSSEGVIIADDLFNVWYPNVTEAVYDFFRDPAVKDLVPMAFISANGPVETGAAKLLIAREEVADKYKAGLKLLNQDDLKHCDPFADHPNVPHFYFSGPPQKRALDEVMIAILDDIYR
ncbi:MAG: hypothetical protein CBD27_07900 [Rhodospirillaceae bacterium TMED167]|nr:hypothetical protein [Rhodospirillaceae bacterium]MDG2034024.1 class I SAM-dependent methyltransferase [Rhodospirillales bacterium]OUW26502.1 MAG: hypothetical protein CBD27_07900 [Rhodospirillaceae bacterium TMED167]